MGYWKKEEAVLRVEMELNIFFLIIGAIVLIGFTGRLLNRWTRIPESIFLIIFGLMIGPVSGVVDGSALLQFLPPVSIAAMVVILVESGLSFDVSRILSTLGSAFSFTLLVAVITTLLITGVLVFGFGWNVFHAALLGIISSGTTTITSMALLKGLDVGENVRGLIMLETIINDFTLILGTFIFVDLIKFSGFDVSVAAWATLFDLAVGVLLGFVVAFIWRYVLEFLYSAKELNYASTIGLCFLLYFIADVLGGNPIIAIFSFALFFGNYCKVFYFIYPCKARAGIKDILGSIQSVQTDFAFFMKTFFFFMLGVTFNISLLGQISPLLIAGAIIAILFSRYIS